MTTLCLYELQMYTNKISLSLTTFVAALEYFYTKKCFMFFTYFVKKAIKISMVFKKDCSFKMKKHHFNDPSSTQSHLNVRLATTALIFISIDLFERDHNCSECTWWSDLWTRFLCSTRIISNLGFFDVPLDSLSLWFWNSRIIRWNFIRI